MKVDELNVKGGKVRGIEVPYIDIRSGIVNAPVFAEFAERLKCKNLLMLLLCREETDDSVW